MLGIIAGIISVFAFFPYVISIFKRKTIPNRITWWIWSWTKLLPIRRTTFFLFLIELKNMMM